MKTFQEFVSEMTYGRGRGPIGGADRNNSPRYRNLGSPTPEQEKENKSREDKAAAAAVAKLRRARGMKEEVELDEGVAGDVADRAQKLANQRKGQTPERKERYQDLAYKARARQRKKDNPNDLVGASRFERSQKHGPLITPASSQRASSKETLGGGTYERGPQRLPKSKEKYRRQVATGVRAASSQEKKRLGVGESYDVQELFITKLTPEQKRKKKVETLIRLMKHAKDPAADVAKTKKEDYELGEAIRNPESRKKLRDIEDKEVRKGDKSKGENPRSKYPTEKGKLAGHLLRGPESTGSKGNPVRSRGGTNAPADERVGKGPNRAGNAAYWASVAGPTRDRGAGNKAARRAGKSVPNTRDDD